MELWSSVINAASKRPGEGLWMTEQTWVVFFHCEWTPCITQRTTTPTDSDLRDLFTANKWHVSLIQRFWLWVVHCSWTLCRLTTQWKKTLLSCPVQFVYMFSYLSAKTSTVLQTSLYNSMVTDRIAHGTHFHSVVIIVNVIYCISFQVKTISCKWLYYGPWIWWVRAESWPR